MKPRERHRPLPHPPALPEGWASHPYRVTGPEELLEAFAQLSPEARGRVIAEAMRAEVTR